MGERICVQICEIQKVILRPMKVGEIAENLTATAHLNGDTVGYLRIKISPFLSSFHLPLIPYTYYSLNKSITSISKRISIHLLRSALEHRCCTNFGMEERLNVRQHVTICKTKSVAFAVAARLHAVLPGMFYITMQIRYMRTATSFLNLM